MKIKYLFQLTLRRPLWSFSSHGSMHIFLSGPIQLSFQAFNPEEGQTWEVLLEARFRASLFCKKKLLLKEIQGKIMLAYTFLCEFTTRYMGYLSKRKRHRQVTSGFLILKSLDHGALYISIQTCLSLYCMHFPCSISIYNTNVNFFWEVFYRRPSSIVSI